MRIEDSGLSPDIVKGLIAKLLKSAFSPVPAYILIVSEGCSDANRSC